MLSQGSCKYLEKQGILILGKVKTGKFQNKEIAQSPINKGFYEY